MSKNSGIQASGRKVLEMEARAIRDLVPRLDEQFVGAVKTLLKCKGRVVVSGMGKSGLIAHKISSTLSSTGCPAFFLHPAEGVHGDLGMVSRGDAVILISNSGETEELIKLLPVFRRLDLPLISLLGNVSSTLGKNSLFVLNVGVAEEAGPMGLVPTSSTTAALAMGDALSIALLEDKGFKVEDFAFFHPGGVLGKQLLLKVKDVWHSGTAIPGVKESTSMAKVILEMTSKKLGMTTVTNSKGRLTGIITDGDLRRLLEKEGDVLKLKAKTVMTRNPRVISPEDLAAGAIREMEKYSITSIIAVNRKKEVLGIVHFHDLLKIGVV